ncbi:hypothetical protein FJTKL_06514 [Diaporthe vaccinii]|uniref:Ent-kaurene oxidase n=1 Tax=Diaporthe vaccinii TaxID=105482 RepID=A0ABR4DQ45_9PEZI
MVPSSPLPSSFASDPWTRGIQPLPAFLITIVLVAITVLLSFRSHSNLDDVPILNSGKGFSPMKIASKRDFVFKSKEILARGRRLFAGKPYRLITDLGEIIFLPIELCEEVKNDARLSFGTAFSRDFHGHIPGFEGASEQGYKDALIQTITRKQLTRSIAQDTPAMSEEAAISMSMNIGEPDEWKEIHLKPVILETVARVSSRVFVGELCRDKKWIRTTMDYTVNFFIAATYLRIIPGPLRRICHWFLPQCREARRQFDEARRVIAPVIEKRRALRAEAQSAGRPPPNFHDAIDLVDQEAVDRGVSFDPATFQLMLSVAAMHATVDLCTEFILQLAASPQYFAPIREEVVRVLKADGWTEGSLYNMKLLDSALKESQRHKPPGVASLRRRVEEEMTLSNGLVLKVGNRIAFDTYRMGDPELHKEPEKWDPYRFLRMREQAKTETEALLVTTSPNHLAFGMLALAASSRRLRPRSSCVIY